MTTFTRTPRYKTAINELVDAIADMPIDEPAFHMKRREAKAPIGPRSARAESAGRNGQALALAGLGLPLTMTRALGVVRHAQGYRRWSNSRQMSAG